MLLFDLDLLLNQASKIFEYSVLPEVGDPLDVPVAYFLYPFLDQSVLLESEEDTGEQFEMVMELGFQGYALNDLMESFEGSEAA